MKQNKCTHHTQCYSLHAHDFCSDFHETGFVNKNSSDEIFTNIISQVRGAHSLKIVATNRSQTSITNFRRMEKLSVLVLSSFGNQTNGQVGTNSSLDLSASVSTLQHTFNFSLDLVKSSK